MSDLDQTFRIVHLATTYLIYDGELNELGKLSELTKLDELTKLGELSELDEFSEVELSNRSSGSPSSSSLFGQHVTQIRFPII